MDFNKIRGEIELIFDEYRKHKYYTLFINDYYVSLTSQIDEIGGGRSNETSDKVANQVVKMIDKKEEAAKYVSKVEAAVDLLPSVEKEIIQKRYMSRDHNYINDYNIYSFKLKEPISANTYRKIRKRAFLTLYNLLHNTD